MVKIPTPGIPLQNQPVKPKTVQKGPQQTGQTHPQQQAQGANFARQAVSSVTRIVQDGFDIQSSSVAISRASTILQTQRSGLEAVGEKLQGLDRTLKQTQSRSEESKGAGRAVSRGDVKAQIATQLEELTGIIEGVRFQGRQILGPQAQVDPIETGVQGRPNVEFSTVGLDVDALGLGDLDVNSAADIEAALRSIDEASRLVRGQIDAIDHSLLDLEIDVVSLDVAAENRFAARADFSDISSLPAAHQGFGFSESESKHALLAQGSDSDALNQLLS